MTRCLVVRNRPALNVANITVAGLDFTPSVQLTDSLNEVRAAGFDGAVVRIRQDGRVWRRNEPARTSLARAV